MPVTLTLEPADRWLAAPQPADAGRTVARVRLDDGRANSFNPGSLAALEVALDRAAEADAVVIEGRPGFFSGGLDLKRLPAMSSAELSDTIAQFTRTMMRAWTLPRPTVATVTGHALGGGAILALAADLRVAAEGSARFSLLEVPMGIPLPGFAIEFARAAVGSGALLTELAVHGRDLTPADALRLGVHQQLAPAADLEAAALARAASLARLPAHAYASTKARARAQAYADARRMIEEEAESFFEAFQAFLSRNRR